MPLSATAALPASVSGPVLFFALRFFFFFCHRSMFPCQLIADNFHHDRTFRWREFALPFNLRRPPLVVSVPAGAPGWRTAAARGEALSTDGGKVFRKPRGLRAHLHVVPGEREIRRALSAAGCEYGSRCGIYQVCSEAPLGIFCISTRADLGVAAAQVRKHMTFLMAATELRALRKRVAVTQYTEALLVLPIMFLRRCACQAGNTLQRPAPRTIAHFTLSAQ